MMFPTNSPNSIRHSPTKTSSTPPSSPTHKKMRFTGLEEIQNKTSSKPISPLKNSELIHTLAAKPFNFSGKENLNSANSNSHVNIIGTLPKFSTSEKSLLGRGASKSVFIASANFGSLSSTKNTKSRWKDVALSRQINCEANPNLDIELRVFKELEQDLTAPAVTPKIYYVGLQNNRLVTATKLISGGNGRNCFPNMTYKSRLDVLIGYAHGLKLLHSKNIIHNDTALRNILVQFSTEKKLVSEALNCRLAKPIFDNTGKTLIESKERITADIQLQLKNLGYDLVKVFNGSSFKGLITDFDQCTFPADSKPLLPSAFAIDCTAPERKLAFERFREINKIFQTQNSNSHLTIQQKTANHHLLLKTKKALLEASNTKTDAFSYGQLLCDAILRPNLDTDLTQNNPIYLNQSNIRINQRMKVLESLILEKTLNVQSALDPDDYQKLELINVDLANLIRSLLSYNSEIRPSISDAILILDKVKAEIENQDDTINFDNIFKSFDAGKIKTLPVGIVINRNPLGLPAGYS